jgi:hypothetical protein
MRKIKEIKSKDNLAINVNVNFKRKMARVRR